MMKRVLIVDDSSTMRMMLCQVLDASPRLQVVGCAKGAAEALALIETERPDIILIDLHMPYIDGARLLGMLSQHPLLIKIILTSRSSAGLEQKMFELGASAFYDKRTITDDPAAFRSRLITIDKAERARRLSGNASDPRRPNVIMAADRFPLPPDEVARLAKLADLGMLNDSVDPYLDILVKHTAEQTAFPICAVNLIGARMVWAKATVGIKAGRYAREESICAQLLCENDPVVIPDASVHPKFSTPRMVSDEPRIRAYAAAPILAVAPAPAHPGGGGATGRRMPSRSATLDRA